MFLDQNPTWSQNNVLGLGYGMWCNCFIYKHVGMLHIIHVSLFSVLLLLSQVLLGYKSSWVKDWWLVPSGCQEGALQGIWYPKTSQRSWLFRLVRRNVVHLWVGLLAGSRATNAREVSAMDKAGQEARVDGLKRTLKPNRFLPVMMPLKVSKSSLLALVPVNAEYL